MSGISCVAIFCEDIREEVGRQQTLIGMTPPIIRIPNFPIEVRKVAIYYRIQIDLDYSPKEPLTFFMHFPGVDVYDGMQEPPVISPEDVQKAIDRAKEANRPLAVFVGKAFPASFELDSPRSLTAGIKVGEKEIVGGFLEFKLAPPKPTTSESTQQSASDDTSS